MIREAVKAAAARFWSWGGFRVFGDRPRKPSPYDSTMELYFHLAIPCRNLEEAKDFYINKLGCQFISERPKWVTLNFFGHQLVTHLDARGASPSTAIYPRHFGAVFHRREDFESLVAHLAQQKIAIIGGPHKNKVYISDPSNNILEFKCRRRDKKGE